jgi:hypothetical protein
MEGGLMFGAPKKAEEVKQPEVVAPEEQKTVEPTVEVKAAEAAKPKGAAEKPEEDAKPASFGFLTAGAPGKPQFDMTNLFSKDAPKQPLFGALDKEKQPDNAPPVTESKAAPTLFTPALDSKAAPSLFTPALETKASTSLFPALETKPSTSLFTPLGTSQSGQSLFPTVESKPIQSLFGGGESKPTPPPLFPPTTSGLFGGVTTPKEPAQTLFNMLSKAAESKPDEE